MQVAITEKGIQDIGAKDITQSAFEYLKQTEYYQVSFAELKTVKVRDDAVYRIERHFDLVTDVYVKMSYKDVELLTGIEVTMGGQRIDKLAFPHVQLKTNAFLYGYKKLRHDAGEGESVYLPLTMAPFHKNNVWPQIACNHHDLVIHFIFKSPSSGTISIYGKIYHLDKDTRIQWMTHRVSFMIQQTQGSAIQIRPAYKFCDDTYIIPANFLNHPVSCIYVWGFDPTCVQSIAFLLNHQTYYEGSIETLRLYAKSGADDPVIWRIGDDDQPFTERQKSTINFSRIDAFHIKLVTSEDLDNKTLFVSAISHQPIVFTQGMCGLKYSK